MKRECVCQRQNVNAVFEVEGGFQVLGAELDDTLDLEKNTVINFYRITITSGSERLCPLYPLYPGDDLFYLKMSGCGKHILNIAWTQTKLACGAFVSISSTQCDITTKEAH